MSHISDIRSVGYAVPDLEAERSFYTDVWGLKQVDEIDGLVYLATEGSTEKYVVRLRQADERQVDVISFSANEAADVDALYKSIAESDVKVIFEPRQLDQPGGGYGIRFFDLNGMTLEVSSDVEKGPAREFKRGDALPIRVSHVVLHSGDPKATSEFYADVLGFKVSDWLGDFMCFMRCNEWHHRIAFLPGPPCMNHVAYDVLDTDEMMRGLGRVRKLDEGALKWGPGRHTAGDNTFAYFTTPNDFVVEYTSGLEVVDDATWEPTVYPGTPEIVDQWGSAEGGPQTMPKPAPDPGLWKAAAV